MGAYFYRPPFSPPNFIYPLEVDFQLDSFHEYIKITESIIEKEINLKILEFEKFLEKASEEEISMAYFYDNMDHEIKIYTQQLYYSSIFISLYSFLEKKMSQLCKIAEKNQRIKTRDISGDGIFKYKTYLEKVVEIEFTGMNKEWDQINIYNKLRNILIHSPTATIEKTPDNLKHIEPLKRIKYISVKENEGVVEFQIKDQKFLMNFLKIISTFLHKICLVRA